jgi:hypothetical protein
MKSKTNYDGKQHHVKEKIASLNFILPEDRIRHIRLNKMIKKILIEKIFHLKMCLK